MLSLKSFSQANTPPQRTEHTNFISPRDSATIYRGTALITMQRKFRDQIL